MRTISQSQIYAYTNCPRNYYLSYIRKMPWPAPVSGQAAKISQYTQKGKLFHLFVSSLLQGIPAEVLTAQSVFTPVSDWNQRFLSSNPLPKGACLYPEFELSAIHAGVLWIGFMDVLAVEKEKCTIFDWKTTKKPSTMDDYAKSPQTRLYLFILRHCIARFLSLKPDGVQPNQIDMVYWFPNAENQQITLHYSEEQYQSDAVWLKEMAKLLSVDDPMKYPETTNLKQCLTCRYFSFCRKEAYPSTEDEFPDDDASLNSGLPDNEVQSAGDEDQPEIIF